MNNFLAIIMRLLALPFIILFVCSQTSLAQSGLFVDEDPTPQESLPAAEAGEKPNTSASSGAADVVAPADSTAKAEPEIPDQEEREPAKTQDIQPERPVDEIADLLEWKALMAEKSLAVQESDVERYALLDAREKLVERFCMPKLLQDLQYTGPEANNAVCADALGRLQKLDPDNPTLICARDGIDSESCQRASLTRLTMSNSEFRSLDTGMRKRRETGGKIPSGFIKIVEKLTQYKKQPQLGTLHALNQEYKLGFQKECDEISIAVKPRDFVDPEFQRQQIENLRRKSRGDKAPLPDTEKNEEFLDLIEKLEKVEKGNETKSDEPLIPEDAKVLRIRILPDTCYDLVYSLLAAVPHSSIAICQRDGLSTRFCVEAIRQEKKIVEKMQRQERIKANPRKHPDEESFTF